MPSLTFTIPWEYVVSDNRKYVSGKFILTPQYRDAKQAIGTLSLVAARKAKWKRAEGRLVLEVRITEPDKRTRDLNYSKVVKDGITAGEGVWWDDCQVRREVWDFADEPDKKQAGAVVTISPKPNGP